MSTLFETLYAGHAAPFIRETFGEEYLNGDGTGGDDGLGGDLFAGTRILAVQLKTGQAFEAALFERYGSERDETNGIANVIKGRLWLPLNARPKQQEQWLIIEDNGTQTEMTCVHYGQQSGGLQAVELVKVDVTRFERPGLK